MHLYGAARRSRATAEVAIAMLTSAALTAIARPRMTMQYRGWLRDRVRILREGTGRVQLSGVCQGQYVNVSALLPDRSVAAFLKME